MELNPNIEWQGLNSTDFGLGEGQKGKYSYLIFWEPSTHELRFQLQQIFIYFHVSCEMWELTAGCSGEIPSKMETACKYLIKPDAGCWHTAFIVTHKVEESNNCSKDTEKNYAPEARLFVWSMLPTTCHLETRFSTRAFPQHTGSWCWSQQGPGCKGYWIECSRARMGLSSTWEF